MSEFRIFSIAVFVTGGLLATVSNHSTMKVDNAALCILALAIGFAAVAFLGKKKA